MDGIALDFGDLKHIEHDALAKWVWCFQHFNLFPHLTVHREPGTLAPIWVQQDAPKDEAEETAMQLLDHA